MLYLLILGALILIGLSATAIYYVIKLRNVKKQQEEQVQKNKAAWESYRSELIQDLRFIASSMLQDQCEITEGCLRLVVLMDRLDEQLQHKPEFKAIQSHFNHTKSMPTHKAYKALSKQEQFKLDKQRYSLEEENKKRVLLEVQTLYRYDFDAIKPN